MTLICVVINGRSYDLSSAPDFYPGFVEFLPHLLTDARFTKVLAGDLDSARRKADSVPIGERWLNVIHDVTPQDAETAFLAQMRLFIFTNCLVIPNSGTIPPPPIKWR